MKFSIIDIETTGGNALHDKITEIAVYVHDGTGIVEEFSSLINPECEIPPFISRLTGINNEMVESAPRFFEVAKSIVQITEGTIFVAHNAMFDYGFLRNEFKSLGYNFSRDYLCTVKLSRKLFPGFRSYSLGNLCKQLNIIIENRHRAGGDALATVKLFEMLLEKNKTSEALNSFIKNDYVNLRFPPGFNTSILDKIPESHGVYYFHDDAGKVIYIGKSNNIKKRVLSHFRNKQSRKAIELRNSIVDISFEETGNELIALLLESDEIKRQQPFFNHALKRTLFNYGIFTTENENGYLTLQVKKVQHRGNEEPVITMGTHDHALEILDSLIIKYELCQKLCGVFKVEHACFGYSIKKCKGACIGKEDPREYNSRVEEAVNDFQYKDPNFMIIGPGRSHSEKSIVQVEKGKYIGYGYFESEFNNADPENLKDLVKRKEDNRDVNRIIRSYLMKQRNNHILVY